MAWHTTIQVFTNIYDTLIVFAHFKDWVQFLILSHKLRRTNFPYDYYQLPTIRKRALYTVRCLFNAVNFLTNIHKRHPIACALGRCMWCLLCSQHLINILPEFLQPFMQYLTTLDRVLTALDCINKYISIHMCSICFDKATRITTPSLLRTLLQIHKK